MTRAPVDAPWLARGFRVWPTSWQPLAGAKAFSTFARQQNNPQVTGMLCSVWGKVKIPEVADWPPVNVILAEWK